MDLNGKWTKAGELNHSRNGHNIIYDGKYLMIIGGGFDCQTEKCSLTDGSVSCTSQKPVLDEYFFYPELFPVPDDFCEASLQ